MQRTVRRRAFHNRSRNGCVTFKMRHIRCDNRTPTCLNCERSNRSCYFRSVLSESGTHTVLPRQDSEPRMISGQLRNLSPSRSSASNLAIDIRHSDCISDSARNGGLDAQVSGFGGLVSSRESLFEAGTLPLSTPSQKKPVARDQSFTCNLPDICQLCISIDYVPPLLVGLPPKTVEVFHHYWNMLSELLILPPSGFQLSLIAYRSIAFPLGSRYDFLKHSLIYASYMAYIEVTGHIDLRPVAASHLQLTLRSLQGAVGSFSIENADAIIVTSRNLAYIAQNWYEWTSYITGYSVVARLAQGTNIQTTVHPEYRPNFWLKLSQPESVEYLPSSFVRHSCGLEVERVVTSLIRVEDVLNCYEWVEFGFEALYKLALGLRGLSSVLSIDNAYRQLQICRIWMSSISGDNTGEDHLLRKLMRVHFFVLLSAVLPYFPPMCSAMFARICGDFIQKGRKDFAKVSPQMRELVEIL